MSPGNGGPGGRKGPRFATRTQLWPRGRPVGPWAGQDHAPGLEGPETAHAVVGPKIGKNWERRGRRPQCGNCGYRKTISSGDWIQSIRLPHRIQRQCPLKGRARLTCGLVQHKKKTEWGTRFRVGQSTSGVPPVGNCNIEGRGAHGTGQGNSGPGIPVQHHVTGTGQRFKSFIHLDPSNINIQVILFIF